MEKICKNCKWWGDERLVFDGKEINHMRRCMKVHEITMYTLAISECDEELNAWESKVEKDDRQSRGIGEMALESRQGESF